ncbi:MAG TPA: hypothetical protein VFU22_19010 [Roseiflexaceae bacterium]|nr:hypothetical protein [Roseiflexaceae bacterium]
MDRQAMLDLCARAKRACEETAEVRMALRTTRAETAALIAQARHMPALGAYLDTGQEPTAPPAPAPIVPVEQTRDATDHEMAMEVLRMMRTLLDGFPTQMQVTIVKALTARTMLVVAAQLQAQQRIVSSA